MLFRQEKISFLSSIFYLKIQINKTFLRSADAIFERIFDVWNHQKRSDLRGLFVPINVDINFYIVTLRDSYFV